MARSAGAGQPPVHGHDWRVAEVVYDDGPAVRMLECWCGATDVDAAA